jgi:methyl-accepting chemotaxis protein
VASEVRSLAQRSAEAAKEIKALISTSTDQVGEGVNLVGAAGRALQAIGAKVLEIDSVVGDIAGSAQEQALGLTQINATVNQMDQATQQNAAMVEQAAAAAHSMRGETETLSDVVATFEVGAAVGAAGPRLADAASQPRPSPAEALRRKAAAAVGARLASGG